MLVHIAWTSTFLRRANNVIYFPEDRNEVRASVHARVWCVCMCVCASRWTRRPYNRWHYMKKFLKVLELFKDPPREGLWSKKYERSQLKTCKNATQRAILSGSSPFCVTLHSRARIYEMLGVFASRTTLRSWLRKAGECAWFVSDFCAPFTPAPRQTKNCTFNTLSLPSWPSSARSK